MYLMLMLPLAIHHHQIKADLLFARFDKRNRGENFAIISSRRTNFPKQFPCMWFRIICPFENSADEYARIRQLLKSTCARSKADEIPA